MKEKKKVYAYTLKNIPVRLWLKVKKKAYLEQKTCGEVVIEALQAVFKGRGK